MRSFHRLKNKKLAPLSRLLSPYLFVYLADGILTYMLPIHISHTLPDAWLIGVILSFTSIGSIAADIFIPILFKNQSWSKILKIGTCLSITFPLSIFLGIHFTSIFLFCIASLISGIYMEFLSFAVNEYINTKYKAVDTEKNWSIVAIFESIADGVSSFIGSSLILLSLLFSPIFVLPLQAIALVFIFIIYRERDRNIKTADVQSFGFEISSVKDEIYKFFKIANQNIIEITLLSVIWSFDALIWTYGALWSIEKFSESNSWIITSIYQVSMLFGALVLLRYSFQKFEKVFTVVAMALSMTIFLITLFFSHNNVLFVLLFTAGSLIFSFGFPLIASIFTDIARKNSTDAEEAIGLKRILYSFSYIAVPVIGGFVVESSSYDTMFLYIIGILAVVSVVSLVVYGMKASTVFAERRP